MRKRIKYGLIIFIVMIFLSGCDAKESILIENTGLTNESLKIYADNEYYFSFDEPITTHINNQLDLYENKLYDEGYNYKAYTNMDESGAQINKTYDNLCDYFNKSLFIKNLYGSVNCLEKDGYYEISSNSNVLSSDSNSSNYVVDNFDNISFSIESSFDIVKQNADDVKNGIYTWKFNKDNLDKSIHIKIKTDKKFYGNNSTSYKKNKKKESSAIYILILSVILVIILIIMFLRKRRNKIKLSY